MADPVPAPRVAFICSAGGGVAEALVRLHRAGAVRAGVCGIVTDRACGAEAVAAEHGLPHRRVVEADATAFSRETSRVLRGWQATHAVLLFTRRIEPSLLANDDTRIPADALWNLHPSLLPAHPGLGALERARAAGTGLGVTLHVATDRCDAGPVLAQGRFCPGDAADADRAAHVAFLLKAALLAAALDASPSPRPVAQDRIDSVPWQRQYRGVVPDPAFLTALVEISAEPWFGARLDATVGARTSEGPAP